MAGERRKIIEFTSISNPAATRLLTLGDESTGERFEISIEDFFSLITTEGFFQKSSVALTSNRTGSEGTAFRIQFNGNTAGTFEAFTTALKLLGANSKALMLGSNDTELLTFDTGGTDATFVSKVFVQRSEATAHLIDITNTEAASGTRGLRIDLDVLSNNTASRLMTGRSGAVNRILIHGNGNIQNENNSYGSLSDAKIKDNIKDARSQWDDIKAVRLVNAHLKSDKSKKEQLMVIAQDLEKSGMNGLVDNIPDDIPDNILEKDRAKYKKTSTKSVKYSVLYLKALGALQEVMERLEALEAKVN